MDDYTTQHTNLSLLDQKKQKNKNTTFVIWTRNVLRKSFLATFSLKNVYFTQKIVYFEYFWVFSPFQLCILEFLNEYL